MKTVKSEDFYPACYETFLQVLAFSLLFRRLWDPGYRDDVLCRRIAGFRSAHGGARGTNRPERKGEVGHRHFKKGVCDGMALAFGCQENGLPPLGHPGLMFVHAWSGRHCWR